MKTEFAGSLMLCLQDVMSEFGAQARAAGSGSEGHEDTQTVR